MISMKAKERRKRKCVTVYSVAAIAAHGLSFFSFSFFYATMTAASSVAATLVHVMTETTAVAAVAYN